MGPKPHAGQESRPEVVVAPGKHLFLNVEFANRCQSGERRNVHVLALVTQKGGSGKSTLAVGLAVAAMADGERVALIEADAQGTISKWKERRANSYPCVERVSDPSEM